MNEDKMLEPTVTELEPGETWCAMPGHGLQFMVNAETGKRVLCEVWGEKFEAGSEKWRLILHPQANDPRRFDAKAVETGLCEECHREINSNEFATCAIHGIQPGAVCPVCAAVTTGRTASVEGGVWALDAQDDDMGGPLPAVGVGQVDDLEPNEVAEPETEGSGGDGEGDPGAAGGVFDHARARGGDSADWTPPSSSTEYEIGSDPATSDFPPSEVYAMWWEGTQRIDLPQGSERELEADGGACAPGSAQPTPPQEN